MKLPDVNILVAVYRDDDPRHPQLAVAVEHSATLVTLDRDFARSRSCGGNCLG